MSKPFEKFSIRESYHNYGVYVVKVWPVIISSPKEFSADSMERREAQLDFIQSAIKEKLGREQ